MKKLLALTLALAGLGVLAGRAFTGASAPQERAATLDDLAWMEGRWVGKAFGGIAEEIWSAPKGGGMMGMFRLLDETGKVSLYEFFLIEEDAKGLRFSFKHFGKGYTPWEKERPLSFVLENWTERRFQFLSPDEGQSPTHMLYAHPDEDQMLVTVQTIHEGRDAESFDVLFERKK